LADEKKSVVRWLEIGANLGIVTGLLLVAFQIAQQDEIASINVDGQIFSNITAHYQSLAGEEPAASLARALDDPGSMTTEDHVILYNLYMAEFMKAMREEILDDRLTHGSIARWLSLVSNPYGYAWWKTMSPTLGAYVPQLFAGVEKELDVLGPTHANQFRKIKVAIEQNMLDLQVAN
jgi:hypothetical protein